MNAPSFPLFDINSLQRDTLELSGIFTGSLGNTEAITSTVRAAAATSGKKKENEYRTKVLAKICVRAMRS